MLCNSKTSLNIVFIAFVTFKTQFKFIIKMSNRTLRILPITILLIILPLSYNSECTKDMDGLDYCFCADRVKWPGEDDPPDYYFMFNCLEKFTEYPHEGVWGYRYEDSSYDPDIDGKIFDLSHKYYITYYPSVEDYCIASCNDGTILNPILFHSFKPPTLPETTYEGFTIDYLWLYTEPHSDLTAIMVATMYDSLNFYYTNYSNEQERYLYSISKWYGPSMEARGYNLVSEETECYLELVENWYRYSLEDNHRNAFRGLGHYDINEIRGDDHIADMVNCHELECIWKGYEAGESPICSDGKLYYKNGAAGESFDDLCDDYVAHNASKGMNICDTAENCAQSGCELNITCEDTVPENTPVCGDNYQLYSTAEAYCNAKSDGLVSSFFTCDSECTQELCDQRKCQDSFTDYSDLNNAVCHSDGTYHNSVHDFCSICDNSRSDAILCGVNQDQICSQTECCEAECNTHGSTVGCNAVNELESYSSYCTNKCADSTYTISLCHVNGEAVDCETCGNPCIIALNDLYESPDSVCGTNDVYYGTKEEFCAQKESDSSLDVLLCPSDTPCANEVECCVQNCVVNNSDYQGGCYEGHLEFISEVTDYCQFYCGNNRSAQLVSNDQDECCSENCLATENRLDACHPTSFVLTTASEQCDNNCTAPNVDYLTCGTADCTQVDCDVKKCVADDPNHPDDDQGVCGSNSVFYADKEAFCEAKQEDPSIEYVPFADAATRDAETCNVNACVYNNEDTYYARCDVDFGFYDTVHAYCTAINTHELIEFLMCEDAQNPGEVIPCDKHQCEVKLCVENFKPVCGSNPDYALETDAVNYCENFIADSTYADGFTSCPSGCTVDDCALKKCLETNAEKEYCGNDGVFFLNKNDFCSAQMQNPDLNEAVCDNRLDCSNEQGCAINHCIDELDDPFEGVCDENFTTYSTDIDYCTAQYDDPNFSVLNCLDAEGNEAPCTLAECCEKQCEEEFQPLCNANFVLVTVASEYCSTYCADPGHAGTVHTCENGCAQLDCDKYACLDEHPNQDYCASNGIFYHNNDSFCDEKILDTSLATLSCNGADCTSQDSCDIAYCIHQETDGWYSRCDQNFNLYQTPEDYCQAKHSSAGIVDLLCGSVSCTANECCQQECASHEYVKVCGPAPDFVFYDEEAHYCETLCEATDFASSVNECEGDCTQYDCNHMKCVHEQPHNDICGSDSVFYLNKDAFCTEKLTNGVTEILCEGQECGSETDCCFAVCQNDNPEEDYVPRCNGEYEFLETRDDYCHSFCSKSTDHEDLMCGSAFCTETECCNEKCIQNNQDYQAVCSSEFVPLALEAYCENYCDDSEFIRYSCPGGCDVPKCEHLNCTNQLDSISGTICLFEPYKLQFFFNDVADYCETKVSESDYSYTIGARAACSENDCTNEEECCISRCLEEGLFTGCGGNDFRPVTPSQHCYARCKNPSQYAPLVQCYKDNGSATNCDERLCCMKQLATNNVPQPLCSSNGTVFLSHSSYCNHKVNVDTSISLLVDEDIDFSICGTDANLYSNIYAFCSAKAKDTSLGDTQVCRGSACNTTLCCNAQCDAADLHPVIVDKGMRGYNAFRNLCYANCAVKNVIISMTCDPDTDPEDCKLQYCLQNKCNKGNQRYVCASDNSLYPSACEAECRGLTRKFNCSNKTEPGNWQYWLCDLNCSIN